MKKKLIAFTCLLAAILCSSCEEKDLNNIGGSMYPVYYVNAYQIRNESGHDVTLCYIVFGTTIRQEIKNGETQTVTRAHYGHLTEGPETRDTVRFVFNDGSTLDNYVYDQGVGPWGYAPAEHCIRNQYDWVTEYLNDERKLANVVFHIEENDYLAASVNSVNNVK